MATGRGPAAARLCAPLLAGVLAAAGCGRSGPGNGLVPANPSAAELTVYVAVPVRGHPATHLPSSVVTIDEPEAATGLGLALDGLHRTGTRCSPADPFIQAIFFSTPPGGRMVATVVNIDTHCGTVMRPVHSRLYRAYRETPAVAALLQRLLRGGSSVDGGPFGAGGRPRGPASSGAPPSGSAANPGAAESPPAAQDQGSGASAPGSGAGEGASAPPPAASA